MKRLMTIALVLTAVLAASAQGKWTYSNYQADELKGQQAYTAYQYEVPSMARTCHGDGRTRTSV